jgi:hypothetical protein
MQPLGTDIWHVPGHPLRMPGGVWMPLASTVIRLPDRSLAVYSPIDFDDVTAAALADLGDVAHLIAPSRLHHLFAASAAARWPRAQVHAASGVRAKQPALRIDHELGAPVAAWRGALEIEHIAGAPAIDEHVAFHRPSSTLICSDLLFHVTRPANLRTRVVLAVMGVGGGHLAQSRAWRFARRDRAAAQASVERVLSWPFKQLAPCHGEPCPVDAAALAPQLTRLAGASRMPALAAP